MGEIEVDEKNTVSGLLQARARGKDLQFERHNLGDNCAEFAGCCRDTVSGRAVAGREDLAGDDERGRVLRTHQSQPLRAQVGQGARSGIDVQVLGSEKGSL